MKTNQVMPDQIKEVVGDFAFLLDLDAARDSLKMLQHPLDDAEINYLIWYAVKCNPHTALLKALYDQGCRFEVASIPELLQVLSMGVAALSVPYTNPIRSITDNQRALELGVRIFTVDSLGEITRLSQAAHNLDIKVSELKIVLRLAVPGEFAAWDLSGKFGIALQDVNEYLSLMQLLNLELYGFSFHVGSQTVDPQAWVKGLETTAKAVDLSREYQFNPELIDIGGGFPVSYHRPDPDQDRKYAFEILQAVTVYWKDQESFLNLTLAIEPGRFIAAPAGRYVTKVIGTADRDNKRWVFTTVGSYNGPSEARDFMGKIKFPVITGSDESIPQIYTTITGPTCDAADIVVRDVLLPQTLSDDDVLEFIYTGAYSTPLASAFNGFATPPIFIVEDGQARAE